MCVCVCVCMTMIPKHLEVEVALLRSRPLEDGLDLHDVGVAVAVNDSGLLQARLQVRRLPDGVLLDGIMRVSDPDSPHLVVRVA